MNQLKARLDALRGSGEHKRLDARGIAALTAIPGCRRRSVLDGAGISKSELGTAIGFPMPSEQSQFALSRGMAFEAQVKANGCAELLTLLRDVLGLQIAEVPYQDLETVGENESLSVRARETAKHLIAVASETEQRTLFDHPLLRLEVAGSPVFPEPDVLAYRVDGKFYVVEIKSFAVIDGQAPAAALAAAETQAAVYVHALRETLRSRGADEQMVSPRVVLVCPENFSNRPTAVLIDVTNHVAAVRRMLARMDRLESILDSLPPAVTLDPWRDAARLDPRPASELTRVLRMIDARYGPECLDSCELAKFCRREERGSTVVLGRHVRDDLGGLCSVEEVVGLAGGTRAASPDQLEQAVLLRQAQAYRDASLGGAA
ncbi:hypothetical protein [Cryptosporangium sp. NPDC051539]|uniref:hypothetical protein n=1 Tax=Cryptosporangium sp. NPDC051539 TaxID=3363962 RepID=UPI003797393A